MLKASQIIDDLLLPSCMINEKVNDAAKYIKDCASLTQFYDLPIRMIHDIIQIAGFVDFEVAKTIVINSIHKYGFEALILLDCLSVSSLSQSQAKEILSFFNFSPLICNALGIESTRPLLVPKEKVIPEKPERFHDDVHCAAWIGDTDSLKYLFETTDGLVNLRDSV